MKNYKTKFSEVHNKILRYVKPLTSFTAKWVRREHIPWTNFQEFGMTRATYLELENIALSNPYQPNHFSNCFIQCSHQI